MSDIKNITKLQIEDKGKKYSLYSLKKLSQELGKDVTRLPYSIRVLLENQLRNIDGYKVKEDDMHKVLDWDAKASSRPEIPHMPARVVMQDFTGVPAVVDLAAMRKAIKDAGGDADKINPLVDTAMVIDHSVQVDFYGTKTALAQNVAKEFERNGERYSLLKWAQKAFDDFIVVPPGMGIIHQVNLEYLAKDALVKNINGEDVIYPDTLVGTDSHTTMINGVGVVGWGVGGIEAEAVMLGQPYYMVLPDVVGVKFTGKLKTGVTATDLVLKVTEVLRKHGVVGKFVEYYGEGLESLPLPDRATIANMAPEYGATIGFFPVDEVTLDFFNNTNRSELVDAAREMYKEQLLFRENPAEEPEYSSIVEIDLSEVESNLAGPKRPQDRVAFHDMKKAFAEALVHEQGLHGFGLTDEQLQKSAEVKGLNERITHGSVAIAAITSCTNTSNPSLLLGAGLLAKKANEKGLKVKPFVKTSLAPGSQVVTQYLEKANLLPELENLGFNLVGYGCTTCIGNSGPLDEPVVEAINEADLIVASVSSGNRNFEGRINPHVKANYLASPIHVVAYALAGTVDFDPVEDAIGKDAEGNDVYLADIWPTTEEIAAIQSHVINSDMFKKAYATVLDGTEDWQKLKAPEGKLYEFDSSSTYIQCPNFFEKFAEGNDDLDIKGARTLLMLGDSVTTDHISPAGAIPEEYPAGQYLKSHGVEKKDFNSYGSRRGNHEVMMRGTFANIRIRNLLLDNVEGGFTKYHLDGSQQYVFDAAMKYKEKSIPLVILAGKEYGTGSSRDWAAKGTFLLGVKAVIAESYERIHRSNLVGMGVLPLEYVNGQNAKTLGLDGTEMFNIKNLNNIKPRQIVIVEAVHPKTAHTTTFEALARLDADVDVDYLKNGGILQTVLKDIMGDKKESKSTQSTTSKGCGSADTSSETSCPFAKIANFFKKLFK
ncbi:aconitate hydratase 1 [Francisella tularensis subsp. tularensis WY96-3418]|uniref:aconitate hydratase AcnA n=1 Tax=Francisella tularensis TaxID=263 RepID=UPI0000F592BF|nr:aconitate hydratase AcnA [Francisella tularensis]ABO46150.1 aconitate hydratase 1 [Francisella tularensis subsp. tularensis WY96-3418]AKU74221.1 aconitate hydratase 1 [Francisella tularensis subsp. tularensis]